MDIAYWAVVFAGAVSLLVEAYRQFSSSDDIHNHSRYPILKDVNLDALCTSGELIRGFLAYASMYIGAYAVILGSAEVFAIVTSANPDSGSDQAIQDLVVGARDLPRDTGAIVTPEDAFRLGKPIFVSAIIITALSMGIFSPVEKAVRNYSHWIAAVPRGVYRVISALKRINYKSIGNKAKTPTVERFETKINEIGLDNLNEESVDEIRNSITTFDLIQPAVTGQLRDQLFTTMTPHTLDSLLARQKEDNERLSEKLTNLNDDPDNFQSFQVAANNASNNMQALLALLYIRNQKSIYATSSKTPASKILEKIQIDREPNYHALSGAIFLMSITLLVASPLIYYFSLHWIPIEYFRTEAEILGSSNPELDKTPPRPGFARTVEFIRSETITSFLHHFLIFLVCSGAALLSREASSEYGDWKDWSISRIPFYRLFQHSLFPGLAAVVICVIIKLIEYLITVEGSGNFEHFVRINWKFCLMNFVFGFLIAISVYFLTDQHDKFPAYKTILLAIIVSVPYLVWAFFVQTMDLSNPTLLKDHIWIIREVTLLGMPAFVFSISFAILLEWSEE